MTRFLAHALPALLTAALLAAISARADDAAIEALPTVKSAEDVPAGTPLREPEPLPSDKPIVLASNASTTVDEDFYEELTTRDLFDFLSHPVVFGQVAYGEFEFSPVSPLGLENPLNNARFRNPVVLDDDTGATQIGGGFIVDTTRQIPPIYFGGDEGRNKRSFLAGGFNSHDTDIDQGWSEFNPFGNTLLLPGTGDRSANYPSGVALLSGVGMGNPNGFNVVENLRYSHRYDATTGYLKWGQICPYDGFMLGGFGGVAYTGADLRFSHDGEIPGFDIDFRYRTFARIETVTPLAGLVGIVPINGMNLVGAAHGGIDFTDVRGDDYFGLSGFLSDSQHVRLSDNETGFNYGATLGLHIPVKPFTLMIGGAYQHNDNYPTIIRTGNSGDQTQIHFNDQSFWVAGIQIGLDLEY